MEGVIQDWRIVYDAGVNGLNDAMWVSSFWMPNVQSLLRILDTNSWMEDRDMGEMFINFPLHRSVRKCTDVNLRPLAFAKNSEFGVDWQEWRRCLMGFRSEVIRGNRHNPDNPFQWKEVILNLPGTPSYNPNKVWIGKVRCDGTTATDWVCFVDDQQLGGSSKSRLIEGGHCISTHESYLGIQDALRKLQGTGGTEHPGSWAGVAVVVDDALGFVVMTLQEKWDKMKGILGKHTER